MTAAVAMSDDMKETANWLVWCGSAVTGVLTLLRLRETNQTKLLDTLIQRLGTLEESDKKRTAEIGHLRAELARAEDRARQLAADLEELQARYDTQGAQFDAALTQIRDLEGKLERERANSEALYKQLIELYRDGGAALSGG